MHWRSPVTTPSPALGPQDDEVAGSVAPVRVGRQGIYDHERHLVAYELLFRNHGRASAELAEGAEQDHATSQVISATFGDFGVEQIAGDRLLFINLTRGFFTGELPIPCSPEQVVLELLENVEVDEVVLAGLHRLRAQGYRIAIDDFIGEESRLPAVALADYVKIDVEAAGTDLERVLDLARAHNPAALVVVERIEDDALFTRCRAAGADLFQGYGLQRPVTLEAVSLTPSQLVCLRLVRALTGTDVPTREIEQLVASDPALSLRVLKTVTSAAAATRTGVTSLRQAIVLLGRQQLCSWVVLMLLGGVTSVDTEALTMVLARASACARLAEGHADLAYTVGLLSGVASVLGMQDAELVATTGVAQSVRTALVDRQGPAGRALRAVLAYEEDEPFVISDAGHAVYEVSRAYLAALSGAMVTVSSVITPS
ncbi:EAL and HDOD domain-containing protein [Kineococcus aurantiacus]|uniref:EAL and modified HD-GYP domain-containing signal transduction protein n=1 Tax=Kineococcus aurantiacus TaxID=37633 RepID=A0A7Y9J1F3_9ACTN|nr:HDOD domain-containing protein [Kineococcus aurantiacus]NYD23075.1 EAL and modified HD-GYP domain-containing signal transduction protein [Kineococcus aurantiacus]